MPNPSEEIFNGGQIFVQSPIALSIIGKLNQQDSIDILFANFVAYAAANWTYNATSDATAAGLLNGQGGKKPACATIAVAFRLLVNMKVPNQVCSEEKLEGGDGRFLTKPELKCFDRRVIGNVGKYGAKADHQFGEGTYFSSHYFAKVGQRFYDPCLMTTYQNRREPIWKQSKNFLAGLGYKNPALIKIGVGKDLIILMNDTSKQVPGFGSTWQKLLPKECKKVLDSAGFELFKKDQDIKAGNFF